MCQTTEGVFPSDSSVLNKSPFVSNPHLDLSFGPVYGMHPNLRNTYPKGYYFVEGKASATVKGLPFKLSFRQSDEALRFGRASYFKLSFDPAAYSKQNISGLGAALKSLESETAKQQKLLYALESKWSYLYQKKLEMNAKLNLPSQPSLSIDPLENPFGAPSFKDSLSLKTPDLHVPDLSVPSLPGIDSLDQKLAGLSATIGEAQSKLGDLKDQQLQLKADYAKAMSKQPLDFLQGIQKMDFGLTSLGKSSMSKNAVPVQGVHVQYAGEKYFTDVAAGYTLPNQLFSNQAFDQVLYNSGNVFNLGDFFQVNNVRFVSSAKVGYGKENGSHVAVENFYTGASLKKNTGPTPPNAFTSNFTSRFTPAKWKNFTWQNTVGVTWTRLQDSVAVKAADRIALFSSATVLFPKIKSSLESSYRRIPSDYDGFTQGIYLKQTERVELAYKQVLSRRLRTSFRLTRDLFFLQNSTHSSRLINQATADMQYKVNSSFVLTGSYSLLQLQERAMLSPRSDISHLGRLGAVSTHEISKHEFTTVHDISYAEINGFDSVQTLVQANARYAYQLKKWRFGLNAQYTNFKGLTRLYGQNLVIQPEVTLKLQDLWFTASIQRLWSTQFGSDYGMQFKTGFAFSKLIDCDFTMQRFLPTEYALFIDPSLEYQRPFYLKFAVNVHL